MKLIGPFVQLLTLDGLPLKGKLSDDKLEIIDHAGIVVKDGFITKIGVFEALKNEYPEISVELIEGDNVVLPSFVDAHTHICFGGNRANDFAMRNSGKTYLEIAESGGGIWSSVQHTRDESDSELLMKLLDRINFLVKQGVTTIEIKSGYGLNVESELKMLRIINNAKQHTEATIVPTCLAAHLKPKDFNGSSVDYLNYILEDLLPIVKNERLADRVDIFIEKSAFQPEESKEFLLKVKDLGFKLTVHADQFTTGSSRIAVEVNANSADHLEAISEEDIDYLANSNTIAIALPGASIGLGEPFTPARKLLDRGASLAIASDWNPGSAPMGNLLTQASILATFQKLTNAEVLAGITHRAAKALDLEDRGILALGKKADFVVYQTDNFQNIVYKQGSLQPSKVYINGNNVLL